MNVKNLHDTETYRRCVEFVNERKFPKSILIPMKWEIKYYLGSELSAINFISKFDKIFGKSVNVDRWVDNYNAPWFFTITRIATMVQFEKWWVSVYLTTDEQLSYMSVAFPDTIIRMAQLA